MREGHVTGRPQSTMDTTRTQCFLLEEVDRLIRTQGLVRTMGSVIAFFSLIYEWGSVRRDSHTHIPSPVNFGITKKNGVMCFVKSYYYGSMLIEW